MNDYGVPALVGKRGCLHRGRWEVRLNGRRRRVSHVVWEYYNGPIPQGFVIHHVDGDMANDDSENLFCMAFGAHIRRHQLGNKHSVETRARMSAAHMGNKHALGYKHTAEARARIGAAVRARPAREGRQKVKQ